MQRIALLSELLRATINRAQVVTTILVQQQLQQPPAQAWHIFISCSSMEFLLMTSVGRGSVTECVGVITNTNEHKNVYTQEGER